MLPGFIEPHAHPVSIGGFILANDIVAPHEWRMPHKTYPGVSGKENYLKTEAALKRHPRKNHRTTFHHIGLFDAELAQRMADMNIEGVLIPSNVVCNTLIYKKYN